MTETDITERQAQEATRFAASKRWRRTGAVILGWAGFIGVWALLSRYVFRQFMLPGPAAVASYMWNEHLMTISTYAPPNPIGRSIPYPNIPNPHNVGLISDGSCMPNGWTWNTAMPIEMFDLSRIDWSHDGAVNMLYADQRVEAVRQVDLPKVTADPKFPPK